MSLCCCGLAFGGYVAAIEWRSVHVLRPSSSTSGGQSFGGDGALVAAAAAAPAARAEEAEDGVEEVVD